MSEKYPNHFLKIGIDDAAVNHRVNEVFRLIFEDPEESFWHNVDDDSGCL